MNERRTARLAELIKARVAEIVAHELQDPRIGMVTITRVELDRELTRCIVYWSLLGEDKQVRLTGQALDHAARHVQYEVGRVLHTRTVPRLEFRHDQSIAGAIRMQELLHKLRTEREQREAAQGGEQAATGAEPEPPPQPEA